MYFQLIYWRIANAFCSAVAHQVEFLNYFTVPHAISNDYTAIWVGLGKESLVSRSSEVFSSCRQIIGHGTVLVALVLCCVKPQHLQPFSRTKVQKQKQKSISKDCPASMLSTSNASFSFADSSYPKLFLCMHYIFTLRKAITIFLPRLISLISFLHTAATVIFVYSGDTTPHHYPCLSPFYHFSSCLEVQLSRVFFPTLT